jgi:hypothetical protein
VDLLASLSDEEHPRGTQDMSNTELLQAALEVGNKSFMDCNKKSTNNAYLRKVAQFKVNFLKI